MPQGLDPVEWMQNWMISGFPWQLIGYSQYPNLPFLQWVISGIYGLSFVIALLTVHSRRPFITAVYGAIC